MGFTEPPQSPGVLVVSYTAVSPLPRTSRYGAVCFLWHFPAGHPGWALPTTLLCGVRTFLCSRSDHPTDSSAARIPPTACLAGPRRLAPPRFRDKPAASGEILGLGWTEGNPVAEMSRSERDHWIAWQLEGALAALRGPTPTRVSLGEPRSACADADAQVGSTRNSTFPASRSAATSVAEICSPSTSSDPRIFASTAGSGSCRTP